MTGDDWSAEEFGSDLKPIIASALQGGGDGALAAAIESCATIGEAACNGRPMACAAGCPHCCVLNVAVLLPEALLIAEWMRVHLCASHLEMVNSRLSLHAAWYRWMDDEERISKRVTCVMLNEGGSCMIHPVRPIVCHGVSAVESNGCREALAPGVADEPRLVLTDLLRRAVFDTVFASLAEALRESGIDDRSIDLGVGVKAFLEHPEYKQILRSGARFPDDAWR